MGKRESKIEKYLKDKLKENFPDSLCEKWGTLGNPDQVAMVNGVTYFLEIKTADGKEQPNQTRQIERIRKAGCNAMTLKGHDGVDWFIKMLGLL